MNETANKFFMAGDKHMFEMHLKQLGFTKTKKEFKNLKKQEI